MGFGISNREHVRHFLNHADAVVVGSALVKKIEEQSDLLKDPGKREDGLKNIRVFVRQLKSE
ncbi:tryptophan synthase subunit alpha [compost metagenome]